VSLLLGLLLIVGEFVCNSSKLLGFKLKDGKSVGITVILVGELVVRTIEKLGVKLTVGVSEVIA
jgi:hypothetical protein